MRLERDNPGPVDTVVTLALCAGGLWLFSRFVNLGGFLGDIGNGIATASPIKAFAKCGTQSLDPARNSCLREVLALNPNFLLQLAEWQAARAAKGEDPLDYKEFCYHITRLGANRGGGLFETRYCGNGTFSWSCEAEFVQSIGMHL